MSLVSHRHSSRAAAAPHPPRPLHPPPRPAHSQPLPQCSVEQQPLCLGEAPAPGAQNVTLLAGPEPERSPSGQPFFEPNPLLTGKRALITAGASGLGLCMARAFMAAGARVMVCDVSAEALIEAAAQCPGLETALADVSAEGDVAQLFQAVDARLGGLEVLVNNAGVAGPSCGVGAITLADWDRTLAVNLTGQFLCVREALPRLRAAQAQGGGASIINLSSAAGHLGMPGRAAYSASKWAVVGLTQTLALELGSEGIRVNAILPGAVDGPRIQAVIAARAQATGRPLSEVARAYTGQSALGRLISPADIAHMAVFAASDWAAGVTGQSLAVDGLTQALS